MAKSQGNVFYNIVLVIVLNLLVKPFWIFYIDRVVQVQNGNTVFGIYGKYLSLSIVLNILLDMGISNHNQLTVAQNINSASTDFTKFWNTKLLLAGIYLLVMHGIFFMLGSPSSEYPLFLMVSLIQVGTSLAIYVRSSVSGLHLFRYDAWLSVVDKFFVLVVATSIIYGMSHKLTVTYFAALQALGFFIVVVLGLVILGLHKSVFRRFSVAQLKQALYQGFPFAILIFSMGLYTRFDFFLIERYATRGAQAAGEYMAAYRFIDMIGGVGFLLANILLPVFARNLYKNKSSQSQIDFYTLLFMGGGFILASFIHYYSQEICTFLYKEGIDSTSQILSILIWSVPAMFLTNIFSSYLTAAKDLRTLILLAGFAALLYVGINISLLPTLGTKLTSSLSVITFWLLAICFVLRAMYKYHVRLQYILPIILVSVLSVGINSSLHTYLPIQYAIVANSAVGLIYMTVVYMRLKPQN